MTARTVAALYVDAAGPYAAIPGVDLWDETRDARLYPGPHPVVAHPPCARWCKLAKFAEACYGLVVGDDGGTFAAALAAVRRWGGVLEHPAWTLAWPRFGLPEPPARGWARSLLAPAEWFCEIAQSAYGHEAQKLTWLMLAHAEPPALTRWARPRGKKTVTHLAQRHPGDFNDTGRGHADRMAKTAVHLTPPPFAEFMVALARSARAPMEVA